MQLVVRFFAGQCGQHAFRSPPIRSEQERIYALRARPKLILFPFGNFQQHAQRSEVFSIPTCDVLFQIFEHDCGKQTVLLAFLYDAVGIDKPPWTRARCELGERVDLALVVLQADATNPTLARTKAPTKTFSVMMLMRHLLIAHTATFQVRIGPALRTGPICMRSSNFIFQHLTSSAAVRV